MTHRVQLSLGYLAVLVLCLGMIFWAWKNQQNHPAGRPASWGVMAGTVIFAISFAYQRRGKRRHL